MKRFTQTDKWKDPWFRKLELKHKLLWNWLCDSCDSVGVTEFDPEFASFQIGVEISGEDLRPMEGRIERLKNGKLLVSKFIEFQYGKLSADCPAHKPIFNLISSHGLVLNDSRNRVSDRVSNRVFDTLQEKEKEKEKEKKTEGGVGETVSTIKFSTVIPAALDSENFRAAWTLWLAHLKAKKKPPTIHAQDLQLGKLAKMGVPKAIETLHRCIEKNWQGIYEQNENNQSTSPTPPTPKTKEQLDREMLLEAMR